MVLLRTDSSTSHWAIPPDSGTVDQDEIRPQRRIRHLTSITVRNLTVESRKDRNKHHEEASFQTTSLLDSFHPDSTPSTSSLSKGSSSPSRRTFASDDLDLLQRNRRRRTNSTASHLSRGTSMNRDLQSDAGSYFEIEPTTRGDVGSRSVRSRPRRSLSGGGGSTIGPGSGLNVGIKEETEPPSPTFASDQTASPMTKEEQELEVEADDEAEEEETSPNPTSSASFYHQRHRSNSRASIASFGTSGSGSTIRPHHYDVDHFTLSNSVSSAFMIPRRLPGDDITASKSGRTSYASDAQLAKEKQRRAEVLHRRLVDSCVTLSLVKSASAASHESSPYTLDSAEPGQRRRAHSTASAHPSPLRNRLSRSESNSSLPGRSRDRAFSTAATTTPNEPLEILPPFFIGKPNRHSLHPTFMVERNQFLVGERAEDIDDWAGLTEERVLVSVWTKASLDFHVDDGSKGKEKEVADKEEEWKLLVEWDVNLDGLISLGRDPTQFPRLQPNTLIFGLNDEYFTAPLPLRSRFAHDSSSSCSENDSDNGGNLSDPGIGAFASTLRSRRRRQREEDEAEEARRVRKVLVERSLRETRMVRVASIEELIRFKKVDNERAEFKRSIREAKTRIDSFVGDAKGEYTLAREADELGDQIDDLKAVQEDVELDIADVRAELESKQNALRARRGRLDSARALAKSNQSDLFDKVKQLRQNEEASSRIQKAMRTRRTHLITLLSHIFPIDPVATDTTSLLFSILSIPLPNSTYSSDTNDDLLSSALGYTAQAVSALAAYLGVPLHYPIKCLGSRSAVVDVISMMRGPRAFPLYGKGVDRYRFDYGVFLLNKNIEQLMYSQGLTVIDLRNTLPNLKALILALSYDPSQAGFSSSTLRPPERSEQAVDQTSVAPAGLTEAVNERIPPPRDSQTTTKANGNGNAQNEVEEGDETDAVSDDDDSRSIDTMRATSTRPKTTTVSPSRASPSRPKSMKPKVASSEKVPPTARVLGPSIALSGSSSNGKIKAVSGKTTKEGSATRALKNSLWSAVGYGPAPANSSSA